MAATRMKSTSWSVVLLGLALVSLACAERGAPRQALTGTSPLVATMTEVAGELDVPAEILAGVAWTETALRDRSRAWASADRDAHSPRAAGVMGLPEVGPVRSLERARALTGASLEALVYAPRVNVQGAAAILRDLADRMYGRELHAGGDRDRWLEVVERYFDAGAAGPKLALEVRRAVARGLVTTDDEGRSFEIRSFAALYALELPSHTGRAARAVAGEYPASTWVAASSSNYTNASRGMGDIDVVVIHTTQGSYAGAISWFRNSAAQVSAHYVVRASDGDVTQMVHHADIAWHAGNWDYNTRSIGIEHEGYVSDPNWATPAMMQSSSDLTRWLCDNLGIPKDRNHIIGHVEVPGATHTDPGSHWDWTSYMSMVTNGSSSGGGGGSGTLKGVVYVAGDTTNRIGGATIQVAPGGATATGRASDGYFELTLPAGVYTLTVSAAGYEDNSVTRTVTAGQEVWGSVGLSPGTAEGVYRGVIYDARGPDLSLRLAGATVRLSNGAHVVTGDDGAFLFRVGPGAYTATAELMGWQTNSTTRTVVAGQTEWGSIGLMPLAGSENQAPLVPVAASPIGGASVVSVTPTFTVTHLSDPDGDALTLEVEVYADDQLTAKVSTVRAAVPAGTVVASFVHPAQDLPRATTLHWRARALDGAGQASGWSAIERFETPDDGSPSEGSSAPWTAELLPGVGSDAAPSAPAIESPSPDAVVLGLHPEVVVGGATDADGDPLAYDLQISTDDVFEVVVARSGLLPAAGASARWTVAQPLVAGTRYYVRARAADPRLYGAWSAVVGFSVDPKATADDVSAKLAPEEGGCATAGRPGASLPLVLLGLALGLMRGRRRAPPPKHLAAGAPR